MEATSKEGVYLYKSKNKYEELENNLKEAYKKAKSFFDLVLQKEHLAVEDVEKYLDVPSATAMQYLNELEKRGVVRRVKSTGRVVYYEHMSKNNGSAKKHE